MEYQNKELVVQLIRSKVLETLKQNPVVVSDNNCYALSKSGDITITDMRVANELTLNDILVKVSTDEKFSDDFNNMLRLLGYVRLEQEPINIISEKKEPTIYTYLMHDAASGCYKIGKSRNVEHREKTLGAQIPLVKTICTAPVDIESQLHAKYSDYRKRGEWFELPDQAVAEIKELFQLKAV